jgi:hypothetical protein
MHAELGGRARSSKGRWPLDAAGRSCFDDLFYPRGTPIFCAFDVMRLDDEDLTERSLFARKALLRGLVPRTSMSMLYVDHILQHGAALFEQACARDLEGIVAKWGTAPYRLVDGESSWVKIKNPKLHAGGRAARAIYPQTGTPLAPRATPCRTGRAGGRARRRHGRIRDRRAHEPAALTAAGHQRHSRTAGATQGGGLRRPAGGVRTTRCHHRAAHQPRLAAAPLEVEAQGARSLRELLDVV